MTTKTKKTTSGQNYTMQAEWEEVKAMILTGRPDSTVDFLLHSKVLFYMGAHVFTSMMAVGIKEGLSKEAGAAIIKEMRMEISDFLNTLDTDYNPEDLI